MRYCGYDFTVKDGSITFDNEVKELKGLDVGAQFTYTVNDAGQVVFEPVDFKSQIGDNGSILSKE
jgi:hypothetical protein